MTRDESKLEMAIKRLGFANERYWPKCDFCRTNEGTHMHELIARSTTQGNSEARDLSFQPELCSLLCPICHELADTQDMQAFLWAYNKLLWGKDKFDAAFNRVQDVMRTTLRYY